MNPTAAPIGAGVLTVSDRSSAGTREDRSGPALAGRLAELGFAVLATDVVADDRAQVASRLRDMAATDDVALILTSGGTGMAPRDMVLQDVVSTPETVRSLRTKRPSPSSVSTPAKRQRCPS